MEAQPPESPEEPEVPEETAPPGKNAGRRKVKAKRTSAASSAKPKPLPKKRKFCDGPSCSLFLNELRRRFGGKKQDDTEQSSGRAIVAAIVESLTNALPVSFTRVFADKNSNSSDEEMQDPSLVEAPATIPVPVVEKVEPAAAEVVEPKIEAAPPKPYKIPKMPVVNSEAMKAQLNRKPPTADASVNTIVDHNVATEIAKHVSTLRRISLIAEEFHQKTGKHRANAKNLKEIVDSVQEDLMKKLEEAQKEQKAKEEQLRQQQQMLKINDN